MTSPLMDALGMWRLMLSMMRLYLLCVYPLLHACHIHQPAVCLDAVGGNSR